jgi:glycogen debranching enzyme
MESAGGWRPDLLARIPQPYRKVIAQTLWLSEEEQSALVEFEDDFIFRFMKGIVMRIVLACVLVLGVMSESNASNSPQQAQAVQPEVSLPQSSAGHRAPQGYSVGNFGIAAAISEDGLKIRKSLLNPPVLGQWLAPFRTGQLTLSTAGQRDFAVLSRHSVFPENTAQLQSKSTGLRAQVETFAPIGAVRVGESSLNSFIPAIVVQVTLTNPSEIARKIDLSYALSRDKTGVKSESGTFSFNGTEVYEAHQGSNDSQTWLMAVPQSVDAKEVSLSRAAAGGTMALNASLNLAPRQSTSISFLFGVHDVRGYPAQRLTSRRALQEYLLSQDLKQQHADFVAGLPRTGDPEIDVYSRWYLSAGILLTKGLATGEVLTMGYRELNQRDSFWTSGAHLIYWPDLELKMLQKSMAQQKANGQVPLCLLPIIDRDQNIDGNEYLILRTARYYRWYRDTTFLKDVLPHVKRGIEYLRSLDPERAGLPRQFSFWADWKDVPGVEGRIYAPHFDLLWLAALKEARFLAQAASDTHYADELAALYKTAYERINRDVSQGGLWDRSRYVDTWTDGRKAAYTLQDQTLAAPFDVISRERLELLYATLNNTNESKFGVRETYPYIPSSGDAFGPGPGNYHNGGIWPYLNFADTWGRFKYGHGADAERIIKKVGYHDLARFNDFTPNEYLNGETGKSMGFEIQGWDASLFSALYFGAFGLERLSAEELAIHVNLPPGRDFYTRIRVPEGNLLLNRVNGQLSVEKQLARALKVSVVQ